MRLAVVLLNGIKAVLALWLVLCAFAGAAFGDYCSASGGCGLEYIRDVQVGTIDNTGTVCDGYTDYTDLSTEMYIGYSYLITVTNGDAYSGDQCGVWVDWNGDEDFEDVNEAIVISGGPESFTGTITPPEAAQLGATRMRVRIMYTGVLSPCGTTGYGEVEDYTIVVMQEKPYEIWTAEDMQAIGADANYWDKHFRLMADIDLGGYTGTSFNIIGSGLTRFTGVFDGNGHTISNLTYSGTGAGNIGMFGRVDHENAEIKNLILVNPNIDAGTGTTIGSLVGLIQEGSITNCCVEGGSVSGNQQVGGLAGRIAYGTISNCYVNDTSASGSGDFVGGLVGFNGGSLSGSHSTGSVSGDQYIGGLAGYNPGEIDRCYCASDVIGNKFTGGLVGNNGGDMGIGSIANSYSTGTVVGASSTGGLVGFNAKGDIMNCYSTGSVSGNGGVGGLVGYNWDGSVFRSYSASSVDGNSTVGGLAGGNLGGSNPDYTKCFWDVNVNPDVNGISNADDPNVIGKTTVEMYMESTFTDAGWDFSTPIWKMNCEGMSYPKLSWWQPVAGDFVCPDGVDGTDLAVLCEEWLLYEIEHDVAPDGGDGIVNFLDWGIFADEWGDTYDMFDLAEFAGQWLKSGSNYLVTDIAPGSDGDGITNGVDFAALAENWLEGI